MASHYNNLKAGWLDKLVTMWMMETLQISCALENKTGLYFGAQHAWHATLGEFTHKPGLKTMELAFALLDHAGTFWLGVEKDPKSRFPETFRLFSVFESHVEEATNNGESQRICRMIEMKKEQLEAGIKAASNELAKMQEEMFSPPLVFLLVTHPQYGPPVLRAILQTCKNGRLDLDTIFEYKNNNSHLIDDNLPWNFLQESSKGEFEKQLCKN